jgi:hypothetical protein
MKRISTVIRNQKLIEMYCKLISERVGEVNSLTQTSDYFNLSSSTVESIINDNPRTLKRFRKQFNKCKIKI